MVENSDVPMTSESFKKEVAKHLSNVCVGDEIVEYLKSEQERCQFLLAGSTAGLFLMITGSERFSESALSYGGTLGMIAVCGFVFSILLMLMAFGTAITQRQFVRLAQANNVCERVDIRVIAQAGLFTLLGTVGTLLGYGIMVWKLLANL